MKLETFVQQQKHRHFVGSVNEFLGNSARTDVVGKEMYNDGNSNAEGNRGATVDPNAIDIEPQSPESWQGAESRGQIPHLNWGQACLGLPGAWCFGNHTELHDVLTVGIDYIQGDQSYKLDFIPTRNWWTPAILNTSYRSKPVQGNMEYPFSGYLTVREKKCITSDNVFVSELTLIHDNRVPGEYHINIMTPHFPKEDGSEALIVDTQTKAGGIGEKVPIKGYAALLVSNQEKSSFHITLKPFESITIRYSFCVNLQSFDNAYKYAEEAIKEDPVFDKNVREFDQWFEENVPPLHIDRKDIQKVYYYRWFVVYRALHDPRKVIPHHPYPHSCFYESPMGGWFGCVIGLSVPIQLQETKWLRNGEYGYHHIQNWAERIGNYQGYLQYTPVAIWDYYKNYPNREILEQIYEEVKSFCLEKIGNPNEPEIPIQDGSWGTGAEYQPNFYQFTNPAWDWRHDAEGFKKQGFEIAKLIRLDTATFTIGNLKACANMALHLGKNDDFERLSDIADKLIERVKKDLWDSETSMFYAADPTTGKKADQAACYDSFLPFMWGIIKEEEYFSAFEKFFDPKWFWDEFPVTTVSKTCAMYWSGNCLTGPTEASISKPHQYGCCWNGPAWHYSNSLMAEALGEAASIAKTSTSLRDGWLEFMNRWTDMHFLFGDKSVPLSNEHVRTSDGARFRRINDYFHSAWLDPFIRYGLGIRLDERLGKLIFDPFTEGSFEIYHLPAIGRVLSFIQKIEDGRTVKQVLDENGQIIAENINGEPIIIENL